MLEISNAEALLLEFLGLPFLAFVLNSTDDKVQARLQDGTALSDLQEEILLQLVTFLGSLRRTSSANPYQKSSILGALVSYVPDRGASWSIAVREDALGDVSIPDGTDSLPHHMLTLARDIYPLMLLPLDTSSFYASEQAIRVMRPLYEHPLREPVEAEIAADDTFKKLFPPNSEHSSDFGSVYRSTGSGGSVQRSMFAYTILMAAWRVAQRNTVTPSLPDYTSAVLETLKDLRKAVNGESFEVKAFVGVAGLRLPRGKVIDLPWGRLREVTDSDLRLVPPGLSGSLTGASPTGDPIQIDYAGDLVMEMDVPYKIKIEESMRRPVDGFPAELVSQDAVEESLQTLRLGLLLATKKQPSGPSLI